MAGERVGLAGANGAGKSTLLRIVAGLGRARPRRDVLPEGSDRRLPAARDHRLARPDRARVGARLRSTRSTRSRRAVVDLEDRLEAADPAAPPSYATTDGGVRRGARGVGSSRQLRSREPRRGGARRPRRSATPTSLVTSASSAAAGRCASRSRACCCGAPTCSCSTSRPTTSTSKRATGSKSSSPRTPAPSSWSRTIATSSTSRSTRISEVAHGRLTDYACNFSKYELQKEERLEQARHAYEVQQEEIERIEAFIRRFRYQASKATLVQSRIKQLEKIERLEMPAGDEEAAHPAPGGAAQRPVRARAAPTRARATVTSSSTTASTLAIERGERVALVGPNGAGKTTLVKLLAGVGAAQRRASARSATTSSSATSRRTRPECSTRRRRCSTR